MAWNTIFFWQIPSLELTASLPLKIGSGGSDEFPFAAISAYVQGRWLLVSRRVDNP